jgi:hypothetical protein
MERKALKHSLEKPARKLDNFITMELMEIVFMMGCGWFTSLLVLALFSSSCIGADYIATDERMVDNIGSEV